MLKVMVRDTHVQLHSNFKGKVTDKEPCTLIFKLESTSVSSGKGHYFISILSTLVMGGLDLEKVNTYVQK